jgi:2-polyprenyl-3-methyl-5-hydroxy-6-metoxy-1,4-benzoquinol methylase
METGQQKEALGYFKKNAGHWGEKAGVDSPDEVNVIRQRNDFVLDVIAGREKTSLALDIGCGTGNLVHSVAQKGINAIGVDFAEEMIKIAREKARKLSLRNANFECTSIFDYDMGVGKFDLISANGFIEYISYLELDELLSRSFKALNHKGSLVLGSRNRLFNIFSLNSFTEEEIFGKNAELLLKESVKIANSCRVNELRGIRTVPLQKERKKHLQTGVKVDTRYQFTPVQMINFLEEKGFDVLEIFPIHIHGVSPGFKEGHMAIHANISNLLQNYAKSNLSLIPQASSFMIHVKKR